MCSTRAGLQKATGTQEQKPRDVQLGSGASGSGAQAQPTLSKPKSLTAKPSAPVSEPTLEAQFVRILSPKKLNLSPESILCSSHVPAHTAQGYWGGRGGTGRTQHSWAHSVLLEWRKEEEKSPLHERIGSEEQNKDVHVSALLIWALPSRT